MKLTLLDVTAGYWQFRVLFWCSVVWAMFFVVVLGPFLLTCTWCCKGRWAVAAQQHQQILQEQQRRQHQQHTRHYAHSIAPPAPGLVVPAPNNEEGYARISNALHRPSATGARRITVAEVMIERDWCLGILMTAAPVVVFVTGFIWIPVVRLLLETLNCDFDTVGVWPTVSLDPSMPCFESTHIRYVIVTVV
jgi:hypothetical protein